MGREFRPRPQSGLSNTGTIDDEIGNHIAVGGKLCDIGVQKQTAPFLTGATEIGDGQFDHAAAGGRTGEVKARVQLGIAVLSREREGLRALRQIERRRKIERRVTGQPWRQR